MTDEKCPICGKWKNFSSLCLNLELGLCPGHADEDLTAIESEMNMSRGDHIKLLNEPEAPPEQPQQQQPFPRTNVQFGPLGAGFVVQIQLADDIAIVKAFNGEAEEQIANILIQRHKEVRERQRNELAVLRHVNTHRND